MRIGTIFGEVIEANSEEKERERNKDICNNYEGDFDFIYGYELKYFGCRGSNDNCTNIYDYKMEPNENSIIPLSEHGWLICVKEVS